MCVRVRLCVCIRKHLWFSWLAMSLVSFSALGIGVVKTHTHTHALTVWLTPHIRTLSTGSLARKTSTFCCTKCFFFVFLLDARVLREEVMLGEAMVPSGPSVRLSAGFRPSSYVKQPGVSCWAAADVNASCSGRTAAGAGKLSGTCFILLAVTSGIYFDIYLTNYDFIGSIDRAYADSSQSCMF